VKIDSEQWRQTVIQGALASGVDVSDDQARIMGRHAVELLQWNRTTNLTAITDPLDVAVKHYVDAVAIAPWIDRGARILDAGSGGGFPGIPLCILRPDLSVTLVDSVRKKVSFLKYAIRMLGLTGIDAVHGRLEDLGALPLYGGKYDVVVCRAFSALDEFAKLTLPYISPSGRLLAMKGPQADHDHEAKNHRGDGTIILGGRSFSMHIHRYRLPLLDAQRSLVQLTPIPEV
jgi:16S rRNA (guanine527-N7)-methyltransferase